MAAIALFGAASTSAVSLPSGFRDTVVFPGIDEPTNFRFAPDGKVFVAEKTGDILVYDSLADTTPTVFADLQKQVYDNGDRGLLSIEVDPNFPAKPYVYALYAYNHVLNEPSRPTPAWENPGGEPTGDPGCPHSEGVDACPVSGRLVRLTAEGDHAGPEEKILLEGWCQQDSTHSIGDLQFGPEGALYVSGGDGASFTNADIGQFGWPHPNQCGDPPGNVLEVENGISQPLEAPTAEGGALRAQDARTPGDPTGFNGAILRIDPTTGEGLPDNPFAGSFDLNRRKIIAYGFRNPYRFAVDGVTGHVYVDNVGLSTDEEIDRFPLVPATAYNSGWPCYEADEPQPLYQSFELNLCEGLYEEPGSTSRPFFFYDHFAPVALEDECEILDGSAITGILPYHGTAFPASYHGALFFADSVRGCIYVMPADEDGDPDPTEVKPFLSEAGLYPGVDIEEGPEGALYYSNLYGPAFGPGAISKISFDPNAPEAKLTANPPYGDTPLDVTFDAGESTGPSGELEFDWDLNDDGTFEEEGGVTQEKTYTDFEHNATVVVKVTDKKTLVSSIAEVTVYPGDHPPQVHIATPSESLTWGVGQEIGFDGSAKEFSSGEMLPPERLYWKSRILHCPFGEGCHRHPLQVFPSASEGSLIAPDHDYPSFIELSLTATDFRGLAETATVKLAARPVEVKIASEPPGINITAGSLAELSPFNFDAIEDSAVSLVAPKTAVLGGASYSFKEWSDGGARIHSVLTKDSTEYRATYVPTPTEQPDEPVQAKSVPRPELRSHPARKSSAASARFAFAVKGRPDLSYRCRLDGGPFQKCHSPRVYRHLKSGGHAFRVKAIDAAGRSGKTATFKWRVL